jgi:hypothetical protein
MSKNSFTKKAPLKIINALAYNLEPGRYISKIPTDLD